MHRTNGTLQRITVEQRDRYRGIIPVEDHQVPAGFEHAHRLRQRRTGIGQVGIDRVRQHDVEPRVGLAAVDGIPHFEP